MKADTLPYMSQLHIRPWTMHNPFLCLLHNGKTVPASLVCTSTLSNSWSLLRCQQSVLQRPPLRHWHLNRRLTPLSAIARWLYRGVLEPVRTDQFRVTLRQAVASPWDLENISHTPSHSLRDMGRQLLGQKGPVSYTVPWFLGAFTKLLKSTISFVMSVCP